MPKDNFILLSDAYKTTHWKQYPKDTRIVYSYLESRGGQFDETLQFGLQAIIKQHFEGVVLEQWMIDDADEELQEVFGTCTYFNRAGWQRLLDKHGGKLPLRIKAIDEGTWVPKHNALVTIENTDEEFPWLTNFVESIFLHFWYPTTVATLSGKIRQLIQGFADKSSDNGVSPFHLNDFGFRGASCLQAAKIGGAAHLVNFLGTDTLSANTLLREAYNAPRGFGKSVFATEHSTTTIYGKDKEEEAYRHFLTTCSEGIVSLVSDSYNIWEAIKMFGTTLKDLVLSRGAATGFAKLVVRPDSGDPVEVSVKVIKLLDEYFGSTTNSKGYKVLHPKVGVIYGDGINYDSIGAILDAVTAAGYSTDCIVFGMGGGLLQQVNRDTHKFAFKCSAALRGTEWIDVYKQPITDTGKNSKRGRLKVIRTSLGQLATVAKEALPANPDELHEVFLNGQLTNPITFEQIRKNAQETQSK